MGCRVGTVPILRLALRSAQLVLRKRVQSGVQGGQLVRLQPQRRPAQKLRAPSSDIDGPLALQEKG